MYTSDLNHCASEVTALWHFVNELMITIIIIIIIIIVVVISVNGYVMTLVF